MHIFSLGRGDECGIGASCLLVNLVPSEDEMSLKLAWLVLARSGTTHYKSGAPLQLKSIIEAQT
jgi:hypothetical protein